MISFHLNSTRETGTRSKYSIKTWFNFKWKVSTQEQWSFYHNCLFFGWCFDPGNTCFGNTNEQFSGWSKRCFGYNGNTGVTWCEGHYQWILPIGYRRIDGALHADLRIRLLCQHTNFWILWSGKLSFRLWKIKKSGRRVRCFGFKETTVHYKYTTILRILWEHLKPS